MNRYRGRLEAAPGLELGADVAATGTCEPADRPRSANRTGGDASETALAWRCEFICQGCGKRANGENGAGCDFHKPHAWYARKDGDGVQVACSRECIDRIAGASGKTRVVLPL